MQDKTQQIFRDAPVPKAVLTNVIPSIISMLMVLVYNLADTFFIGQTKDPLMVAAVSIATSIYYIHGCRYVIWNWWYFYDKPNAWRRKA